MAVLNLEEPKVVEFAAYLIEKGADVNLGDVNKRTPLHLLAANVIEVSSNKDNK
jgi:ankyrin repeat protein